MPFQESEAVVISCGLSFDLILRYFNCSVHSHDLYGFCFLGQDSVSWEGGVERTGEWELILVFGAVIRLSDAANGVNVVVR